MLDTFNLVASVCREVTDIRSALWSIASVVSLKKMSKVLWLMLYLCLRRALWLLCFSYRMDGTKQYHRIIVMNSLRHILAISRDVHHSEGRYLSAK